MSEEYDDLELEFDLTPEQLEEIEKSLTFSNARYVYFDKVTGDILNITDQKNLNTEGVCFEIDSQTLHSLLPGTENSANFRVTVDLNNKFNIVPKVITLNPKLSSLTIIPRTDTLATLTVFNDIENKNWIVVLNEDEKQRLYGTVVTYMKQVYVTAKQNKNILYRSFNIDLNTLIALGSITVPHEMVIESITSKIQLFTIKFFDSYALQEKI
jgi:hypothetical protein